MKVKIIIYGGIVSDVLADGEVDVEVVDIDKDYEDYHALLRYEEELRQDLTLKSRGYTCAHFEK